MEEYFVINGFDLVQPIFNVEFEMHRSHLRAFSIITVEDALQNAQKLFKQAMDDIRLIDLNTISEKDIEKQYKKQS